MAAFLTRRSLRALFTLWLIFTLVFIATRASGDPLKFIAPTGMTAQALEEMRVYLGLDKPVLEQYRIYFLGLFQGETGLSFFERRPVGKMFAERMGATLRLAVVAFAISTTLGVVVGILAALNRGKWLDFLFMSMSFVGYALPNFMLGITMILVFSFWLHWLPSSGQGSWQHYLMPALALGLPSSAGIARLARSAMLDVINQDYMRTARAKGLSELFVNAKHALRNAAIPILTVLGLQVGTLIAGSVIVETVFAWPGVGSLLVKSALGRDYPVLQFGVVIVGATVIVANLLVDVLYGLLDPRIRVEA